jgi:uncharacterized surface protein with fasciclin (FAS1) repeats
MLQSRQQQKNIVETVRRTGEFNTLITALQRAGLDAELAKGGPFTMFAPSDEAFGELPDGAVETLMEEPETLTSVLSYHIVPRRVTAAEAAWMRGAPTVNGEDVLVLCDEAIHVDGARLVEADIEASNGLIHVIDRVLLPAKI